MRRQRHLQEPPRRLRLRLQAGLHRGPQGRLLLPGDGGPLQVSVVLVVSHRNGFRAEYSGRNLVEYSAETVLVKIMGFGYERNIR